MKENLTYIEIKNRYRKATMKIRLFIRLRWLYTPYPSISSHLPDKGEILDLGCGYGLFSLTLALLSGNRVVIGIDHDEDRILQAKIASNDISNISFATGTTSALDAGNYSGVAMLDFLHYFAYDAQEQLLKRSYDSLLPGGVMIFREVDTGAGFVSILNRMYEKTMVALKFTKAEQLFFRTKNEWEMVAQKAGYQTEYILHHRFPFRDVLFICKKQGDI